MKSNLLAISIGNTRTRIGTFVQDELASSRALPHDDFEALASAIEQAHRSLSADEPPVVLIASVHPAMTKRVEQVVSDRLKARPLRVGRDMAIPIGRQLDREAIVGEDRLLNAAAAYDVLKQACVVVDAGTAVTVDLVDGAGTFHGGAIGAGAQLMLQSLHARTGQLPEVTMARPTEAVGHSTVEAMRSAVYYGLRGMVRELVEKYAEVTGAFPMVVVTGGDAELLFEDHDLVDRIVPDLTLMGMAVTLRTSVAAEP